MAYTSSWLRNPGGLAPWGQSNWNRNTGVTGGMVPGGPLGQAPVPPQPSQNTGVAGGLTPGSSLSPEARAVVTATPAATLLHPNTPGMPQQASPYVGRVNPWGGQFQQQPGGMNRYGALMGPSGPGGYFNSSRSY